MKHTLLLLSFFFFFTCPPLYSDSFRVNTVHTCIFESEAFEPLTFSIGYNDAVAFAVKSDFLFLEGIELEIKQSSACVNFPQAIAYGIYTDIIPEPAKKTIDYSAQEYTAAVLPNRFSHIIRIPFKSVYRFKQEGNAEILPYERKIGIAPFMLRLKPVAKDVPEAVKKTVFTIIVRPLLIAEGGLKISLRFPESEKDEKVVSVQLNNRQLTDFTGVKLIPPGNYSVIIHALNYRNEMRSCIVERGKITHLDVTLQSTTPLLYIKAPENAIVFLDEKEIDVKKPYIPITVGMHTIVCKLGNYEITRQITAEEGKTYRLTMNMDVGLEEVE